MIAIFCLIQLTRAEDRISVDTVGTITATAGYSITDSQSPTSASLTSSLDFPIDHHGVSSSKETTSASAESGYTPAPPPPANRNAAQSLALRSRQARGKPPHWSGQSAEEKDHEIHFDDHRLNEQLYNVKPQTFDDQQRSQHHHHHPSTALTDSKSSSSSSDESAEKSMPVPSITYGKKMVKNDGHDDRPVFGGDWSEEVRMKFDAEKPVRSRKRNKHHHQDGSQQDKRKPQQTVKTTTAMTSGGGSSIGGSSSGDNRDGWQEVSPNMEIATGFSTTVHEHESSQESQSSGSSGKRTVQILDDFFKILNLSTIYI